MTTEAHEKSQAIAVDGLWQVFGADAEAAFQRASGAGGSAQSVAAELSGAELIPAVQDVTLDVKEGEIFMVMGLSGSGKSTLVRCISRLVEPTAGSVTIFGEDILQASKARMIELRRDRLGMVFQHFGLFPHMTVAENVAFPLKMQGKDKKTRRDRAFEILDLVGLKSREDAFPRQLSGGQKQRVGIARSLAVNPDIWFLDEPFSALDPLIRRQLQDEFLSIQERLGKSIVFITHDIAEALKLADRIAIMRDGRVVQIGTPADIVLRPVDDYVREFSRDVAKGQHARLSSIMQPLAGQDAAALHSTGLRAEMTLNDALATCISTSGPFPVYDHDQNCIGMVRPEDLTAALVNEAKE